MKSACLPPLEEHTYLATVFLTKEKLDRYICPICQKRFSRPSALQTHSYIHSGEKPYECHMDGCGRRFSVVSNLRRHFKVHRSHTLQRKRLSSDERGAFVQRLMARTSQTPTYQIHTQPIYKPHARLSVQFLAHQDNSHSTT